MKRFNTYLIEKLKVSTNSKIDNPRDYKTVGMLISNATDKRKFQEYLRNCLERDNYGIQTDNIKFMFNKVIFCDDKINKIICDFSVNDTYTELYDRIIDALKEDHFIHEKLKLKKGYTDYIFYDLQPLRKIDFDYWDFAEAFKKWAKTFNKDVVVYPLEDVFYDPNDLPIVKGTSDPYRPKAFYPDQYVTGLMIGKTSEYGMECFRLQTKIKPEDVEKFNEINKKYNSHLSEIFSCEVYKGNLKLELAKILGKGDYKMGYAVMKYIYDEITNEII